MAEADLITRTTGAPPTVSSLCDDLLALGVRPRMILMVHSSLSALGWVVGGAQAVVLALEAALGEGGTLVMPAHSYGFSDPSLWRRPSVPEAWWDTIRAELPVFDPALTPTTTMGAIAECFRNQDGVIRSTHPIASICARGPVAPFLAAPEPLGRIHGKGSTLERLYDADAWVLLLGVSHQRNTSLHLAERRAKYSPKPTVTRRLLATVNGRREWVSFEDVAGSADDFDEVGSAFKESSGLVHEGKVGYGEAKLMPMRPLVDFAIGWFERNRGETVR